MSRNPYQTPKYEQPKDSNQNPAHLLSANKLKSIVVLQKLLIFLIAGRVIGFVVLLSVPPEIGVFAGFGTAAIAIFCTITVFLLAIQVYSVVQGIFWGLISLIPCIGLLVLLQINGEATSVLQENGIKVGLFGAKGVT